MLTKQEVFNKVWGWFVVQGKPVSIAPSGICCYRSPEGNRCAVGLLIPDELYSPELDDHDEDTSIDSFFREDADQTRARVAEYLEGLIAIEHRNDLIDFLGDLQAAHDSCDGTIKESLTIVAEEHGLEVPEN